MNNSIFKKKETTNLFIKGSKNTLAVNHVFCVGRNYSAHAREMGADDRNSPFFFSKPDWAITTSDVKYPLGTNNLQYEVELVIVVGEELSIFGFGVGVDLTRRDLQLEAKKQGKPWLRSKSFLGSAPISQIIISDKDFNYTDMDLELSVNGDVKQSGHCKDMIWSPSEILCEMAAEIPLQPGDLVFTGTPAGVGTIVKGDKVTASIPGIVVLSFSII